MAGEFARRRREGNAFPALVARLPSGVGIHTEGDTLEELRANVQEAVDCSFDETMEAPKVIRLHFVRDEVLAR